MVQAAKAQAQRLVLANVTLAAWRAEWETRGWCKMQAGVFGQRMHWKRVMCKGGGVAEAILLLGCTQVGQVSWQAPEHVSGEHSRGRQGWSSCWSSQMAETDTVAETLTQPDGRRKAVSLAAGGQGWEEEGGLWERVRLCREQEGQEECSLSGGTVIIVISSSLSFLL